MIRQRLQGFTIVESIIVIALAGLITAAVFYTAPQAERNSRNQARRNIANRLRGEIETYGANHEGQYPFTAVLSANPTVANCPVGITTATGDWADFYLSNVQGKLAINDPSSNQPVIGCAPNATFNNTQNFVVNWDGTGTVPASTPKGLVDIIANANCSNGTVVTSTAANSFAVLIGLENNGRYCTDNR